MNFFPIAARQRAKALSGNGRLHGRSGFSVLELLTVMALISIISGFVVPALKGIVSGNAVDIGASEFSDLLGLARSEAITQHTIVRFVVATSWPGQDADADLRRASLWSWHSDPNSPVGGYFLQFTPWQELPIGVILEPGIPFYLQPSQTSHPLPQYAQADASTVHGSCVLDATFASSANFDAATIQGTISTRYIEFLPSGSARIPVNSGPPATRAVYVLAQGYAENGNVIRTSQSNGYPSNWAQINVDTLTGRARVFRP
jgi:prepilin-type N-terminal cleavage/methylation domain-containing protein